MTKTKKGINPLGAVIAGAVVGAGAMALSNKENREKLMKTAEKVKSRVKELTGSAKDLVETKKEEFSDAVDDGKNMASQAIDEAYKEAKKALE